jgi:hypothetical protein
MTSQCAEACAMVMWLCLYALRHATEVTLQLIQLPADGNDSSKKCGC